MAGPTGVGKSRFAVQLAEHLGGEIIGADAFQIYDGLPVLTARPTPDLLDRIPHHLVGVWDPGQTCDAASYALAARACMEEISGRGKVPLLVGGTGLYLKALTHGLADIPKVGDALRHEISEFSLEEAIRRLAGADPAAPSQIDTRNPVRVRRALEIVLTTGRPLAEARSQWKSPSVAMDGIFLTRSRDDLHSRIAANVAGLFDHGVVEEVRAAPDVGPGLRRAIGYADIQAHLAGKTDLEETRERIFLHTRQYAKRQLTWFRNQFNFPYIDLTVTPDPIDAALHLLAGTNA